MVIGLAFADIDPSATRRLAPAHANKTDRFMGTPYPADGLMPQPVKAKYASAPELSMMGKFIWSSCIRNAANELRPTRASSALTLKKKKVGKHELPDLQLDSTVTPGD